MGVPFLHGAIRVEHLLGAQRQGMLPLMFMLGNRKNTGSASDRPQGCNRQEPDGAAAKNQNRIVRAGRYSQRTVQGARERFDQNGGDVGHAIGNLVDLRLMSHERFAERPARIPTIPRLDPGRQITPCHVAAQGVFPVATSVARRVQATHLASQRGMHDDAVADGEGRHVRPGLRDRSDHFMPHDERHRRHRRKVGTAGRAEGGQIRPADPRQLRRDANPLGRRQLWRRDFLQSKRRPAGQTPTTDP